MNTAQKIKWVKEYLEKAMTKMSKLQDKEEYSVEMIEFYKEENRNIDLLLSYHEDLLLTGVLDKNKLLKEYMGNAVNLLRDKKFIYDNFA
ncbi:hypothetical protein [Paenibacillus sp. O199]|uniref:hypothetical protein n=1 Tax=Paenibacillus sp. O199 TaxID=1643925 RepID=UPI0007BEDD7B|nr:hypothetical protein [Paenibacillus sp. O199]